MWQIVIGLIIIILIGVLWCCCAISRDDCEDCPNRNNCEKTGNWLCKKQKSINGTLLFVCFFL